MTKLGLQMYTRVAPHPQIFSAAQKLAAWGSFIVAPASKWIRLPAFTGWGYSKDFPKFAGKTFKQRFKGSKAQRYTSTQVDKETNKTAANETPAPMPVSPVSMFTNELTALGGHVYQTRNVTKDVIEFLMSRSINKIHIEPNSLDEKLLKESNIEFTHEPDDKILAGVTYARCGLADTGSVLVADGEGNPLRGSLLPEIHIAVLKAKDILPSLPDAVDMVKGARAAVFITGPSRTADIEMTLTIGVHGPKEIHVFIDDSNSG
jgi:L-lactate dehydrogenase complex protein LldG